MLLVFFGFCGLQEQEEQEQEQEHEERKKETRQGGTDIFSTVSNNNLFIVPCIFPVVCPPSLFHSKGRANANNTCKKATICNNINSHATKATNDGFFNDNIVSINKRTQTTTSNMERIAGGGAAPSPRAPHPLFFMVGPRLLLHVATARQQHH